MRKGGGGVEVFGRLALGRVQHHPLLALHMLTPHRCHRRYRGSPEQHKRHQNLIQVRPITKRERAVTVNRPTVYDHIHFPFPLTSSLALPPGELGHLLQHPNLKSIAAPQSQTVSLGVMGCVVGCVGGMRTPCTTFRMSEFQIFKPAH